MRIERLDLERYGHFEDRSLTFPREKRVVVVHGANEAGKSTCLAAAVDLLFGIEVRSQFGFRHGKKSMSVAASLSAPDGSTLAVRRLKRQARTLVDPSNDQPLPDDFLAPLLRGRDRAAFLDGFALDRARLRAAGEALLKGGGDVADALVAAAPGLGEVLATRDRLVERAMSFHNHQRKSAGTELQKALTARDAARKAFRETEVRADEVKRVNQAHTEAARGRDGAIAAEAKARVEVARLERLQAAAKEFVALDRLTRAREAFGAVPEIGRSAVDAARDTLRRLADARDRHATALDEVRSAEEALAAIACDVALLEAGADVEAMDERRAVVANGVGDLPKRNEELASARGELARVAASLGVGETEDLKGRVPGDPLLARADGLVERMAAAVREARECATARSDGEGERARLLAALEGLGGTPDPTGPRARLDALDGCEDRAVAARKARKLAEVESERLDTIASRLRLGADTLDALASLPLPSVARAAAAAKALSAAANELARAKEAAEGLADEVARLRAKAAAIKGPGEVPTAAAVEAARRVRDDAWKRVGPALSGKRVVEPSDAADASALDHAIPEADRLADERWAESSRAAELLQVEKAVVDAAQRLVTARRVEAERSAGRDVAGEAWAALLPAFPSDDHDDVADAMETLRAAHDALSQRERLRALGRDASERVAESDADGRRVTVLAEEIGLDGDATVSRLRAAIGNLQGRFQDRRDIERDLANVDETLAKVRREENVLRDEVAAVERERVEVLPPLAVRQEATAEEARSAVKLWREVRALLPSAAQLERRVARIREDESDYGTAAEELLRQLAPDLLDRGAYVGVRLLRARLDGERAAHARAEDARANLAKREEHGKLGEGALSRLVADADALRVALGAGPDDDLAETLAKTEEALAANLEILKVRGRLDEALGGRPEAEVREELGDADAVALVGLRTVAEASAKEATDAVAAAIEAHVTARAAVAEVEARGGAARAAQDEQDAVAAAADAAEGFVRNHVAARLLAHAVDLYREKHQSPILKRAGEHFLHLTGGRWEGIGVDYGVEPPTLKPLRAGKLEDLDALSEGTADQLALALRVASIEEHAKSSAPMPFVCDDVLVAFDERRTEAGLELLATLGESTQVLLFTHHVYVADSARRVLGEAVEVIAL